MKKILFSKNFCLFSLREILCIAMLYVSCSVYAQTTPPPYINYQKVLYDVNGANPDTPLTNQSFTTFVNINDELGNLLYREEHYASTDANGLITVKMGDGVYTSGSLTNFNQINWGIGKYYLVVDFDINGTISSTAPDQLVTVPYTFYAGNAGNGMTAVADNGNGTLTFTYANGQTYITPALSGVQGAVGPAGPPGTSGSAGPQGAPGPQGQAGINGTNGLNALIKTTIEPVGANCANGGTKIETGSDANSNGVLDLAEVNVNLTRYVCDGSGSATGFISAQGVKLGFANSSTWTCPIGVTQVQVELWGAGGGGGGRSFYWCSNTGSNSCGLPCACVNGGNKGGNGGNGGFYKQVISVIPGTVYTISIGIGGSAGSNGIKNGQKTNCIPASDGTTGHGTEGGFGNPTNFSNLFIAEGGTGGQGGLFGVNFCGACSSSLCSVPAAQDGINGSINNFTYPPSTNIGSRTYIPIGYVNGLPSNSSPGGKGASNYNDTTYLTAPAGENGYCIISY